MKNLTNTLGIDLSSNNGDIDISAVKEAGFEWAMLRVGYGNDESEQDDTRIFDYAKQCKDCGMPFGVYLMSYALNEDYCKSEIAHTKRIISELWDRGLEPDLPIVAIDIEPTDYTINNGGYNAEVINKLVSLWNKEIREMGWLPVAYVGFDEYEKFNANNRENTYIWWAQWNTECQFPGSHDRLVMWQFGGETNYIRNAYIEGVGVVDQNIMYVNPDYYWTVAEPSGDDTNETEKKVNKIIDLLRKVGQKLTEI